MTSERIGTYRARQQGDEVTISTGRSAPIGKRYDLYVEKDGTLRYIPVK